MRIEPREESVQHEVAFQAPGKRQLRERVGAVQAIHVQRFANDGDAARVSRGEQEIPIVAHAQRRKSANVVEEPSMEHEVARRHGRVVPDQRVQQVRHACRLGDPAGKLPRIGGDRRLVVVIDKCHAGERECVIGIECSR
jgi:hypothetical protein